MPTFTTVALHSLVDTKASKSMAAGKNGSDSKQGNQVNDPDKQPDPNSTTETKDRKHHWTQISPALYATPELTPLPEVPNSPSTFTPSPYIVNHKGRGPRLLKSFSENDAPLLDEKTNENVDEKIINGTDYITYNTAIEQDNSNPIEQEQDNETDDFFDPQDSLSVKSSTDGVNTTASEFYDAWEELSSESGSQPSRTDYETELRDIRTSLLLEMEKRKQAEEKTNDLRNQWGMIREQLSLLGLNLTNLEDQSPDDLSNQIHVIRFVSDSIGRGIAKAEVEADMESQLESKNFEIARLLDRLRYYEAVNREMSQRNQETIETMRGVRQRRKRRQKWIWGSVILAVTVGSAALVWSTEKGSSSSSHTCEESHGKK
ncbi:hypothetical protein LXL04_013759 [Taraxacum kok-saghyz]